MKIKQLAERLKAVGKTRLIFFLGLAGIAAIFLSDIAFSDKRGEKDSTVSEEHGGSDYGDYVSKTEERLSQMLCRIEGVGKAEVMLTVSGTEEYVYAQEEKSDSGSGGTAKESKYVVIGSNGGKEALLERIENPEISGVVIVCEGGDSNIVRERVVNAVSAALGLPSNKIYVAKSG